MTDFRPYPKSQQIKSKRVKPTQRQMGDISHPVDVLLKERSQGVCEACGKARAIDRAHLTGRPHIDHRTQVHDLAHLWKECHQIFDGTVAGLRMRRLLAAIINAAPEGEVSRAMQEEEKEKDAYYFSHDSNARNDRKVLEMLSVYGAEGYGFYWILIEMMRDSSDYKLEMHTKYAFNAFALQFYCDSTKAKEFIMDCIEEFGLFESDGKSFWSNSLIRRMKKRETINSKRSAAAKARWDKERQEAENANGMQMQSNSNAEPMQGKERKVKERKVKESSKEEKSPESPAALPDTPPESDDSSESGNGKEKVKYSEDNVYYRMATHFRKNVDEMCKREGIKNGTARANMQSWADDFRLMVENDGNNDLDQIKDVMDWVVKDNFWKSNVMSAKKFREKLPRLIIDMNKGKKSGKPVIPVVPASLPSAEPEKEVSEEDYEAMMRFAAEQQAKKVAGGVS